MNERDIVFRQAHIVDSKYVQYSYVLFQTGLTKRNFRAVESDDKSRVFVHPDDLARPVDHPVTIRRDLVEFDELEES